MAGPLRVCVLTRCDPTDGGSNKQLSLAARVGALQSGLQARGVAIEYVRLPRARAQRQRELSTLPRCDVIWLHREIFWPQTLHLLRRAAGSVVLDIDDPIGYSSTRLANFSLGRWLRFRATCRACDAVIAASDGLAELARPHCRNVLYSPLAVPAFPHATPATRRADEPLCLLWQGGRSTFQYLAAARGHLEAVGRAGLPVALCVLGHAELHLRSLPVRNRAWSVAAEAEELRAAHVGLVPAVDNRWTRAKATLKPLQYLAAGVPLLASPVGVNVCFADQGRNGLLANTPAEWVAAVQQYLRDEPLRQAMGLRGIRYVAEHHAADRLAERVAGLFRSLAASRRAAA